MRENQTLRSIKADACIFNINSLCTRLKNNHILEILVWYGIYSNCFNLNQRKNCTLLNLLRIVNSNSVYKRNPKTALSVYDGAGSRSSTVRIKTIITVIIFCSESLTFLIKKLFNFCHRKRSKTVVVCNPGIV